MKRYLLFLLGLLPLFVSAQLVINELMTNNISAHFDESWNYSMWVEVYNTSASAADNVSMYYFTDDLADPRKWQPISRRIAPGAYHVLFFEREDRGAHANFKLDPEGGSLYLLNASGEIVDHVHYPQQYRNTSYGRIQDGANEWVFFSEYSPGVTNNNKKWAHQPCTDPKFAIQGGFYLRSVNVKFTVPATGEVIYYTENGDEPTEASKQYNPDTGIAVNKTTVIRAISVADDKLPSNIVSATYFIDTRAFDLPVVSLITAPKNLTDNTIGIYVQGTNGIPGNGTDQPANWNQDWWRPANFEFYDQSKTNHLNQELDIAIGGGWSRTIFPQKSLKITPRKKHGDNRLGYDFFAHVKPNQKYSSVWLRNSGNDQNLTMMRDGFMQTLIIDRLDVDYQAYLPTICYINGDYYGIQNLRERSNHHLVYSNYGLKEEDIYLLDQATIQYEPFRSVVNYVQEQNLSQSRVYNAVKDMIDVENLIDYYIAEIFYDNTDWPHNNLKIWKAKENGKWRWILYDTDFGFNNYNNNTLDYVYGKNDPSSTVFKELMENQTFKQKFISRFCIHLSSTFETNRVNYVMDSLASAIVNEIPYHKQRWGQANNFTGEINKMKDFARNRPQKMIEFLGSRYFGSTAVQTISLSSNIDKAQYLFNSEPVIDASIALQWFSNQSFSLEPAELPGFRFERWEVQQVESENALFFDMGSNWKYWDLYGIPATDWNKQNYDDSGWKEGQAQLGYGNRFPNVKTSLSYGGDPNNKYTTAYFRKQITISNLSAKKNFKVQIYVDDGACIYVNGNEIGRYNLPDGPLDFYTLAPTYNNGDYVDFDVPFEFLKEGENLIAVEVHQNMPTSSDLVFDLSLSYTPVGEGDHYTNPVFSRQLTQNLKIKAIYEDIGNHDPNENVVIKINEIVASNSIIQDEYGEKDDYIELYNPGEADVNIAGWFLSDRATNPEMYAIPTTDSTQTLIPANDRIIIWADSQPEQGVLHTNFKLSKDGETVVLSRKDPYGQLVLVDQVDFPALESNMSYSRMPDGGDEWYIQPPTFNLPNTDVSGLKDSYDKPGIFPTLVNTHFFVTQAQGKRISIVDVSGKILLQQLCTSENETIKVDKLQQGVYFVLIDNYSYKKIVKTL